MSRKTTFKKFNDPVNEIYRDFKLLKLTNSINLKNCLFMSQLEQNEKLAKSFSQSNSAMVTIITKQKQEPMDLLMFHISTLKPMELSQQGTIILEIRATSRNVFLH